MISIKGLQKSFGETKVLNGVDLDIFDGERLVIIGRSGCGKSVMLKHIVRLLEPDSGTVTVEDKIMGNLSEKELYIIRKKFGFLFQGAALFDSMSVGENVGLPLVESDKNYAKSELEDIVEEKLNLVGLKGIQSLKPSELSGGMKKRVGLARALITNPKYMLYDEPTTGLDPITSDAIDDLIRDLNDRLQVTSVVVTHDMHSVKLVADRVAMMHEGVVHFTGSPSELMNSTDPIIQEFIARTK